jgi:N-acetylneuraminate synthase
MQFRDVDNFIHDAFKNADSRYIKKTMSTKLSLAEFTTLVDEIKNVSCIPMATPFDEASVDMCVHFDMPIIKVASSDVNDWPLLEKIASTRRPTIISTGGASEKDLDDVVAFFEKRDIPLAVNHCVALYPSEDDELNLNQIDYLKQRYPDHVIGYSTHEYTDWSSSMFISYGKGVRTWERHIDIDFEGVDVAKYNTRPHQADAWFKAFHKAVQMSGGSSDSRRVISKRESEYLNALVRGAYAKKELPVGYVFDKDSFETDFYLAIPLQKGQLSCREVMNGEKLTRPIAPNEALTVDHIDGPYAENASLKALILNRGT